MITEVVKKPVKQKHPRPDGYKKEHYRNLEKWSYQKWAWEFLRRNDDFIKECEKIKEGTADGNDMDEEKLEVALKFGLKKFKDYKEGYNGESGQPGYSIRSISKWVNINNDKSVTRTVSIKIRSGQMLIRFDLNNMLEDRRAYTKQIELAETSIKMNLKKYGELINKKAGIHNHQPSVFGLYIRLLDHRAQGRTYYECAKLLYPEKEKTYGKSEMEQLVSNSIKAANNLAKKGYLYLALSEKPNLSVIPLQKE
jgi:hypothetical protein